MLTGPSGTWSTVVSGMAPYLGPRTSPACGVFRHEPPGHVTRSCLRAQAVKPRRCDDARMLPKSSRASSALPFASRRTRAQERRDAIASLDEPIDEPSPAWAAQEHSDRHRLVEKLEDVNDVPDQRRKFVGQIQRRRRRLAERQACKPT